MYGESHSKGCPYEGETGEHQAGRLSPGQSSRCDLFALTHCILVMAHLFKVWVKFAQAFFISGIWAYFQVLIVFLLPQQARILNLNDLFPTSPLYFDSP